MRLTDIASRLSLAALILALAWLSSAAPARAADKLLEEAVDFTGTFIFLEAKTPAVIIGAIRDGETVVRGFGEMAKGSGRSPDGDTLMRIGSITKVFCGAALASMVADGKVGFTDRLEDRLGWNVRIPELDGKAIRLIDLATHASGLPREAEIQSIGEGQATRMSTREDYIASLKPDVLLFPPGTGLFYSNFGFDLLAQALSNAEGKAYSELLRQRVLEPAGLKDTVFDLRQGDRSRALQGHGFDGSPLPFIETAPMIEGAGGLYSTANDLLRWLRWHLDRSAASHAEMRILDHASYVRRGGLAPVFGLDDAGEMDSMGLGWVILEPEGNRPLILHKTGGLQGIFSYLAFAPGHDIGVFVAINQFDVRGFKTMVEAANELVAELAPR